VGVIDGNAVTKNIGSAGGKVIASDGMFELNIPSGALDVDTGITIQPITNNAPNGNGKAYRCLPDGLIFKKDITIQFRYTDETLAATRAGWMSIAFQNSQKYWQVLQPVTNDTSAKTISTTVNHFTDFVTFDALHIEPSTWFMKPGESVNFQVFATDMVGEADSLLIGVVKNNPVKWSANGKEGGSGSEGGIAPVNGGLDGGLKSNYTAPANAPAKNPVAIEAALLFYYQTRVSMAHKSFFTWRILDKCVVTPPKRINQNL
jgi:hypothetical protein